MSIRTHSTHPVLGHYIVIKDGKQVDMPYDPFQQPAYAASVGGGAGMNDAWEKVNMRARNVGHAYIEHVLMIDDVLMMVEACGWRWCD